MSKFVRTAIALLATVAVPAQSIAGSLAIPIKVGLDDSTQRFLDRYPVEIREQMILALEQAIPLVEAGGDHMLDRVDVTIKKTLDQVACLTPASIDTLGQGVKKFKAIMLGGDRQFGRTDFTDLQKFADLQRKKIGGSTAPKDAEGHYADILGTAYSAHCTYQQVSNRVDLLVSDISNENLARLDVWMYLANLQCPQATACYSTAYLETKAVVAGADPRDKAVAAADKRLADLPVPDASFANGFNIKDSGWFAAFHKGNFQIASYEANVKEMISIQFDLAAQNAARVQRAKKMLDADATALAAAKTGLAPLEAAYGGSSSVALAQAFGADGANAKKVRDALGAIDVDAALAVADAPELNAQAVEIKTDLQRSRTEVGGYVTGYSAHLADLRADEAKAAKEAARRALDALRAQQAAARHG